MIARRAASEVAGLAMDPLWVAGTTMYWAEGSKTSNRLALTNSDPAALRLFIAWTRRYLDVGAEFVLALHLHHGNDEDAARTFWRRALRLPDVAFHKTFVKPPGTGHRKNHLSHGVCRIVVCRSSNHFVRVSSWIDGLPSALDLAVDRDC